MIETLIYRRRLHNTNLTGLLVNEHETLKCWAYSFLWRKDVAPLIYRGRMPPAMACQRTVVVFCRSRTEKERGAGSLPCRRFLIIIIMIWLK